MRTLCVRTRCGDSGRPQLPRRSPAQPGDGKAGKAVSNGKQPANLSPANLSGSARPVRGKPGEREAGVAGWMAEGPARARGVRAAPVERAATGRERYRSAPALVTDA